MRLICAVAITLILAIRAEAQSVCVSYFAAQGFTAKQCTKALSVFDGVNTPCMAVLWGTFGNDNSCIKPFAKLPGRKFLEIHPSNGAGRRNKRLYPYEFLPNMSVQKFNRYLERRSGSKLVSRGKQIALELKEVCNAEGITCAISTELENNFSRRAAEKAVSAYRKAVPWPVIHNPVGSRDRFNTSADVIELHGIGPRFQQAGRACLVNLDGANIHFGKRSGTGNGEIHISKVSDFIKRYRKLGCRVFTWWQGPQGIGRAGFVEPRRRDFRILYSETALINQILKGQNYE